MRTPFKFLVTAVALTFAFTGIAEAKQCPMSPEKCAKSAYQNAMEVMHEGMDIAYSGDVDTDFARGMIPHHQGAVDMAKTVLKFGEDAEIRSFAEWVIFAQTQEIAQLDHWLRVRGVKRGDRAHAYNAEAVAELKQVVHNMHAGMEIHYTGNADVDFALGMIPHHEGAIEMAKVLMRHSHNFELNKLARGIITSQQAEIGKMKSWLKARGVCDTCMKKGKGHHKMKM